MCQLCNGTHVIHEISNSFRWVIPCPECDGEQKESGNNRFADLDKRIAEMEALQKGG